MFSCCLHVFDKIGMLFGCVLDVVDACLMFLGCVLFVVRMCFVYVLFVFRWWFDVFGVFLGSVSVCLGCVFGFVLYVLVSFYMFWMF